MKDETNSFVTELGISSALEEQFPPMDLAFGYGSGVFRQIGYDYSKSHPMIDLFFIVQDADEWHRLNLIKNPSHYSGLGYYLGSQYLRFLQENITPVHFNPTVQLPTKSRSLNIKYGVIDSRQFSLDLTEWSLLTCSGRLHKPVEMIFVDSLAKKKLTADLSENLNSAAIVSLLLNFQPVIPMRDFLMTIASLSYIGDIRFAVGAENSDKIANLVNGNYNAFSELYKKTLIESATLSQVASLHGSESIRLDCTEESVFNLVNCLPSGLLLFNQPHEINVKTVDLAEVQRKLIERIRKINSGSSQKLVLYNAMATSPIKNIAYVFQKLKKGLLKGR